MAAESLKKAIAAAAAKKPQEKDNKKTTPKNQSSQSSQSVKRAYKAITKAGHTSNMDRIDLQKKVKARARTRKDLHKINGQLAMLATRVCQANQAATKTLTDLLKQPENMPTPGTYGPAKLKEHIISAGLWPLAIKGNNKGKPMGIPALLKSATPEHQALGRGFATLAAIASRLNKQQTASKPAETHAAPGFVVATMGGKPAETPAASKPAEPLVKTVYKKDLLKQGSQAPTAAESKAAAVQQVAAAATASKPAPAASKPAETPAAPAASKQQTIVPVPSMVLAAINKMSAESRQELFDQLASQDDSIRIALKTAIIKAETKALKNA